MENIGSDKHGPGSGEHAKAADITPMGVDHYFVIAELAKIGLDYLKGAIATLEELESNSTPDEDRKRMIEHWKGLCGVAGEDAVAHLYHICQYLHETGGMVK